MGSYDADGQRNVYAALIGIAVLAIVVAVSIVLLVPKGGGSEFEEGPRVCDGRVFPRNEFDDS